MYTNERQIKSYSVYGYCIYILVEVEDSFGHLINSNEITYVYNDNYSFSFAFFLFK